MDITQSSDALVSVDLSVPKAHGRGPGKPGTTTPEDLFRAGRLRRLFLAVRWIFAAKQHKKGREPRDRHLLGVHRNRAKAEALVLRLAMRIEDKSLAQTDLAALVQEAHEKICPYSQCHPEQREW